MPKLYELVSAPDIMDAAFSRPALKIKPKSAKRPDEETALKTVLLEVENAVINAVAAQVKAVLEEEYETFKLINGEHEDAEDKDTWEEQTDQLVEEVIEPWVPCLSQSWLGEYTIASGIHLPEGIDKFCNSLGKEYFKQATHDNKERRQMTPAQIMSSAGITKADVQARLEAHINLTDKEKETMSAEQDNELSVVLQKIAAHIGKDYDANSVYDDLDLASDDDDGLAFGAAPRLGISEEDVSALQMERLVHGSDTMDLLMQGIQAILDGEPKKKEKKPAKEKAVAPADTAAEKPEPKKVKKKETNADEEEGSIEPNILMALKDCGASDNDMAKGVGVSRATYNNYANGKSSFSPNEAQYSFLRGEVVDRINKLHEALAALDGLDEPEVVY